MMAILLALLALLLQQQAQSQRALLDLRPAKHRPGGRLIWSYTALFEDEFYQNYRINKHLSSLRSLNSFGTSFLVVPV
jgi:hypothetical protein